MASQMVRVKRKVLESCMTCPLCNKLLKEATTISLCLHTFCRKCIYEKLSSEEVDSCPVCGVDLGCLPVKKLRPDHNLQDTRAKIFPLKKRKINPPEVSPSISLPVKRKERSLSSLVVNTPEVLMQTGLTGPQFQGSFISTPPTYSDFLPPTTEGFHDQNFLLDHPEVQAPALSHPTSPIPAPSPTQVPTLSARVHPRITDRPTPSVRNSMSEEHYHELRASIEIIGTAIESFQSLILSRLDQFEASVLSRFDLLAAAILGLHNRIAQAEEEHSKAIDDVISFVRFNTSFLADQLRRVSDRVITNIGDFSIHLARCDSELTPVDEGPDEDGENLEGACPATSVDPSGAEPLDVSLSADEADVAQDVVGCEDEPVIDPAIVDQHGTSDIAMDEPTDEREPHAVIPMEVVGVIGDAHDGESIPPVSPVANVSDDQDEYMFSAKDFYARLCIG